MQIRYPQSLSHLLAYRHTNMFLTSQAKFGLIVPKRYVFLCPRSTPPFANPKPTFLLFPFARISEILFMRHCSKRHSNTVAGYCPQILINLTCHTAKLIGEEAARQKVKAYVRIHHPYYKISGKGPQDEKSEVEPWGTIGTWWHETLRILGAIEG